jgi:threonyl-tRNA synthetase
VEALSVNARKYGEQAQNSYDLDEFINMLVDEVKNLK